VALFVLGVIGFGTKAGFMPFHVWLPAAHPVAPSPVSALMSGVVIKTGIYGLLRLLGWLPDLPAGCGVGLLIVAMITGIMGVLYALGQDQLKRILAYSSVENIGIIGMAIALSMLGRSLDQPLLVVLGLGGALLHVLNHALFKGLLFLSAGTVLRGTGSGHIERLGGLARRTPLNALAFLCGSLAICALPPLNGFLSEFLIYSGLLHGICTLPTAWSTLLVLATAALALIGGLVLVAFSRVFAVVFLGEPREASITPHPAPRSMVAAALLLALACCAVSALASRLGPALGAALGPCAAPGLPAGAVLPASFEILGRVSLLSGVLVAAALALFLLRRGLPAAVPAGGAGGTWSCGFARPAARMQYTGSSYAWQLLHSFRHAARCTRLTVPPAGCFPQERSLSTRAGDVVLDRGYKPLFEGLGRAFERLWPLQHGRIQLYLMYIVVTVIVVFVVEAASWRSAPPAAAQRVMQPSGTHP
jgi:hydrogenase-4 component B